MSALQLTDPPSDDLNETETVNYGTDTTTNLIPQSSIDPASQRTPAKVSFAYDASLKQASAITPGMATQDDSDEEEDGIDFLGTVKKGGSDGTMAGPKSDNDHYVKVNQENLEDTTAYDAFIPKVSPASPFAKVCFEVGSEKKPGLGSADFYTSLGKPLRGWSQHAYGNAHSTIGRSASTFSAFVSHVPRKQDCAIARDPTFHGPVWTTA